MNNSPDEKRARKLAQDAKRQARARERKKNKLARPSKIEAMEWVARVLRGGTDDESETTEQRAERLAELKRIAPSQEAFNILMDCKSSERLRIIFWQSFFRLSEHESKASQEQTERQDDMRRTFKLIEQLEAECPDLIERKRAYDLDKNARTQKVRSRRERITSLASIQSSRIAHASGGSLESVESAGVSSTESGDQAGPAESEAPGNGRGVAGEAEGLPVEDFAGAGV